MRTKRFIIAVVISVLALPALTSAQGRAVPRGGGHVSPGPGPGRPGGGGPVAVPRSTYRPPYYPYYPNRYPYYGHRPYYGYPYYGYPGYGYGYPGWSFSLYYGYPWYVGPYGFSVGVGYGYPYYGYGYGYPGYSAAPYYGGVRLVVPQRNAEVYVDGYYAGVVNDFDGTFQQVNLEPGPHRIEVRGQSATPLSFDVNVQPGRTVTYRAPAPREAQP